VSTPARGGDVSPWPARLVVAGLALLGAALASYLTLYQWGVTSSVWDPLFGSSSSEAVLRSPISRMLPLPDATLGAGAYLLEAILALLGGANRAHSEPWLVLAYGVVVAGLAVTSVALLFSQLVLVRALCSLCLASAVISLVNAALARDEVGIAYSTLFRTSGGTAHEAT
jgi:uncharacterized membrane protein